MMKLILMPILLVACVPLISCATGEQTTGRVIDAIPSWLGGEPEGVPPRRGTPEYDAWMAKRAEEAARPKDQQ
jgi:hypothetical protein